MRRALLLAPVAAVLALPSAAPAQSGVEGRVGKLESEMRAVQRKVFPGGAGQYLQPEITAPDTPRDIGAGTPATSAVADLASRVASLEGQMATLTGQIEQQGYRQRQLQEAFDAYRRANDARLKAMEGAGAPAAGADTALAPDLDPVPARTPPRAAVTPARTPPRAATVTGTPAVTDMARDTRLAAVTKPDSGDAAEDEYLYGYRLWQAKLYPEAQAQLKKTAAAYPKSRRYSYAQNLLGRAYLDDGKPSLASMAFYDNYKKAPDGERAPESLYYLAQALQKLNKPADACKVYDELGDVYAGKISASMKSEVASGRTAAKCK